MSTLGLPCIGRFTHYAPVVLQDYPDGLTPAEIRNLLGVDRSLADTCLGMVRYGLVQRVGRGKYVAHTREP
jgi:hypothetical protein